MLRNSYYKKLNETEQRVYRQIADGIRVRKTEIVIDAPVGVRVFEALNLDCPEFYFADLSNMTIRQVGDDAFCIINYLYGEETVLAIENKLSELLTSFSKYHGEALLRKIHNYLVKNVQYDWDETDGKKRADFRNHSLVGPLIDGVGVCEGVAKAFSYLASQSGADNKIVTGQCKGKPHCWNMVTLEGKAYHIDVTNDIENSDACCKKPCYFYYLIDDGVMKELADFDDDIPCAAIDENPFHKYGRTFCTIETLSDYLKELPLSEHTIYFKYIGSATESDIVERVAQTRGQTGAKVLYRLDATGMVYMFQLGG